MCLLHAAMLHAGIGATHVNRFLTTLNIPAVNTHQVKKREREVGEVLESVAKHSCQRALWQERITAKGNDTSIAANNPTVNQADKNTTKIGISYDCGWQRRGGGRSHYSMTGVGHAFGLETKRQRRS